MAIKIKLIRRPKVLQNVPHIGLQFFGRSALDGRFICVPQPLDAVEFGAVGRQKIQLDTVLSFYQVVFAAFSPSAAVGMPRSKAGLTPAPKL